MSTILARLRAGRAGLSLDLAFRVAGAGVLAGGGWLAEIARRRIVALPAHQATPAEFLLCAAAIVLFSAGLALGLFGAGLFRDVPLPGRRSGSGSPPAPAGP